MKHKKNSGLSFVEVLVGVALLGIILIVVNSLHLFGQKQYINQTDHINLESNVRLALNIITKDIRAADTTLGAVSATSNVLTITKNSSPIVYKVINQSLTKNSSPIITGIQSLTVSQIGNRIELNVTSVKGKDGKSVTLSTVIYIRG